MGISYGDKPDYEKKYWEAQWHIDALYEELQNKTKEEDEDG